MKQDNINKSRDKMIVEYRKLLRMLNFKQIKQLKRYDVATTKLNKATHDYVYNKY